MDRIESSIDPVVRRKALIACGVGNMFETYDFAIYGFLAIPIAAAFFPGEDPTASLLKSFATFAVGFFMRPVGAMVIGSYSGRAGRIKALSLCFILMASATVMTCLLPGYATLGTAAPVLLIILRMFQGFAVGGGIGTATAVFIEYAPDNKRGLMGSLHTVSIQVGVILGSLVAAVMPHDDFMEWGWRLPFMLGVIPLFVGIYLRLFIPDTPAFIQARLTDAGRTPLRDVLTHHRRPLLLGAGVCLVGVVANFAFSVFLTNFAISDLGISHAAALMCSTLSSVIMAVGAPFAGALSDRVGRRPVIVATTAGFLLLSFPLYLFTTARHGSIAALAVVQALEAILHCGYVAVLPSFLSELFPTKLRSSAISLSYGLVVAVFGGLTPWISLGLIDMTGYSAVPGLLVTVAAAVSLAAILSVARRPRTYLPE